MQGRHDIQKIQIVPIAKYGPEAVVPLNDRLTVDALATAREMLRHRPMPVFLMTPGFERALQEMGMPIPEMICGLKVVKTLP